MYYSKVYVLFKKVFITLSENCICNAQSQKKLKVQRDIFLMVQTEKKKSGMSGRKYIPIFHGENRRLFAQGNQATSNEPIIKWNCLPSFGSRGGRAGQSGWARHPRLCRNNNVNLSPRFSLVSSLLSFFLLLSFSGA